jgi:tetratricopeptide (TPR) repeat protein
VIEQQIYDADLVIVAWSRDAAVSQWVRAEAQKAGKKLLPIRIETVELPTPFNTLHTIDLVNGEVAPLVEQVRARLTGASPAPPSALLKRRRLNWAAMGVAAVAAACAAGLFVFHLETQNSAIESVGLATDTNTRAAPQSQDADFDVRVARFEMIPPNDPDAIFLKTKVERNFVELLSSKGLRVGHTIAATGPGGNAKRVVGGSIVKTAVGWTISSEITSNGVEVAGASLDVPDGLLKETYRSIPEALLFAMRLDPATLNRAMPAKPITQSPEAYLAFLGAQRNMRLGHEQSAIVLLDQAISFDPRFAAALWCKGDILAHRGEKDNAEVLYEQAHKIDPDHSKVSLTTNANPLPALLVEARQAQWSTLEPGLAWRRIEAKAYGVRVTAWAADPHLLAVEVVQADGAYGTPAAALRAKNDALLVVNGGFFDMDAEDRLTPSGLLIIDGQVLRGVQSGAGSGVLIASGDRVTIDRSEDFVPRPEARSGFQSGPLLVDPGGVLGIKLNDFNRVPRTAVCLAGDEVVIVWSLREVFLFTSSPNF